MRKVLFPLLLILLFTACKKETSPDLLSEEIVIDAAKAKPGKIEVCHYDAVTGTSKTLMLNENALKQHLAHGDLLGNCSAVLTTICDKDWMVLNLNVDTYRNGDPIPQVTDPAEWATLTTGAWCYYNNDPEIGALAGKLYNWYAVNDPRGLAPAGWHVPSKTEWDALNTCLGGYLVAGGKMKATGTWNAGTGYWFEPNTDATNSSGFAGGPGGFRYGKGIFDIPDGSFRSILFTGYCWSSTEYTFDRAWYYRLSYDNGENFRGASYMNDGFSVRCVRN
jgi:uncharacterized protein (TIGR02145 family)